MGNTSTPEFRNLKEENFKRNSSESYEISEDDSISEDESEEIFHCNVVFEELENDEINEIQKGMYPGKYSESGFLQKGETLMGVYNNDKIFLEKVNITYNQIYDKLTTIIGKYYRSLNLGKKCIIEGKFKVDSVCYNGAQKCPFQNNKKDERYHGYEYGNEDITISNILNEEKITFNTLLLHMINKHHFFESPLSSHRLDPGKVIEFFDLKSGIDYKTEYTSEYAWDDISSNNFGLTSKNVDMLINIGLKTYKLNNDIIGILLPFDFILDEKFFINILIQDIDVSWRELFESYSYKLSERKINYLLKYIEEYKNSNDLSKMYLYIFNTSDKNNEEYKFNIEGTDIEYNSYDKLCCYKYIKYQHNSLDEFDILL
jgi:hypothetical protein